VTRLLQDLVARQAARRPQASAIVYGAKRLSYGELDAAANRLARALAEAGCRKGDRVGFLYPKKPAAMVWMLGILKAGAMHVPLDLASPAERLRRIVASCEPRFILAAGPAAALAAQLQDLSKIVWMEDAAPAGIDARKVVDTGIAPVINTGIAHKDAGVGQVGAGITRAPLDCFEKAIMSLGDASR